MLNKFQEQDLFASVEELENALECIDYEIFDDANLPKVIKHIKEAISSIKNIKPSLFSYPQEAKYISGEFNSTICELDGEE